MGVPKIVKIDLEIHLKSSSGFERRFSQFETLLELVWVVWGAFLVPFSDPELEQLIFWKSCSRLHGSTISGVPGGPNTR